MQRSRASSLVVLSISVASACSSSSSSTGPAGPTPDAGTTPDSSAPRVDAAVLDASTTPPDASSGSKDGAATDAAEASLSCPAQSTSSLPSFTYAPAVAHQGVCTTAQINDFMTACVTGTSTTACATWQSQNLPAGDAGAGTPCGSCIVAPDNNGGLFVDAMGNFNPNYGACIQIEATSGGTACATAYDEQALCLGAACDYACSAPTGPCATTTGCHECYSSAGATACNAQAKSASTACSALEVDGGAFTTCSPGAAIDSQTPDFTFILELVCGGAPVDAGSGQ